jgi:1,4-alpha-glucan branching enzyme
MGGEFGQWREWVHDESLQWYLLDYPLHAGLSKWLSDLNHVYKSEPAMHEWDCEPAGFEWIDCGDANNSVVSLIRRGKSTSTIILVICNFTPVPRLDYRIGVPRGGHWREVLNSDAGAYGGGNMGNSGGAEAIPSAVHGRPFSLTVTLPPLAVLFFKNEG